jgi:hypothetical protein
MLTQLELKIQKAKQKFVQFEEAIFQRNTKENLQCKKQST